MLEDHEHECQIKAVYEKIGRHVGCAVIAPHINASLEEVMKGPKGTVSFVDTGTKQFILTCDHVWQDFVDMRLRNPEAELVVLGSSGRDSFYMSDARVISRGGKQLDIITLDMPSLSAYLEGAGKDFYQAAIWPPPPPEVGDAVIAVGYPAAHQKSDKDKSISAVQLRPAVFIPTVSSVSDRHIVLAENTDDNPRRLIQFDPSLEVASSLGGISGCAAFVHADGDNRLAGVVYEASADGHESIIYVARSTYILADGTLDHGMLPPF